MVFKERMITDLARKTGFPKYKTKIFLEGFEDLIKDYIYDGEKVLMRGFMTVEVKEYKARQTYNMKTKTCQETPAYKKIKIHPSIILDRIAKGRYKESESDATEEE